MEVRWVHVTLGPMRHPCGQAVVWGVGTQVFRETGGVGYVKRRDLYDVRTERVHRCEAAKVA